MVLVDCDVALGPSFNPRKWLMFSVTRSNRHHHSSEWLQSCGESIVRRLDYKVGALLYMKPSQALARNGMD